ncbi:MAG: caspase family protein, partial [Planctomycetota bacterium]
MQFLTFLVLLCVSLPAVERGLVPLRVAAADGSVLAEFAESHALVIGCSQYRDSAWQKLEGVPSDTAAVATTLEAQGFRVQRLDDPDGARLQQALRELVVGAGSTEKNRILVYYAGHGATIRLNDNREMGYLVPIDAPNPVTDPTGFRRVALSMGEIERLASDTAARHALFVFDACFSGSLFKLRGGPQLPQAIAARMMRPVRQFITSGSASQQVPDHSVFRRYFVRGIDGEADANHDGWVSGTELGEFVFNNTVTDTRNAQTPQIGTIRDPDLSAGDFVFRTKAPLPTPVLVAPAPAAADARDRLEFRAVLAEYPNAAFPSIRAGHESCAWIALPDGTYGLNPLIPAGDGQECIVPFASPAGKVPTHFLGLGPLRLSGRDVADVHLIYDNDGRMALGITFTELGARRNIAFTTELQHAGQDGTGGRMAIVCNGIVRSDPAVRGPVGKE